MHRGQFEEKLDFKKIPKTIFWFKKDEFEMSRFEKRICQWDFFARFIFNDIV